MKNKYLLGAVLCGLVMGLAAWPAGAGNNGAAPAIEATQQYSTSTTLEEFNQEYKENGFVRLPDLRDAKFLAKKGPTDDLDKIEGKETIKEGYQKNNHIFMLYKSNGKVYGITIANGLTKEKQSFWDNEHDGEFEQMGSDFIINASKYTP